MDGGVRPKGLGGRIPRGCVSVNPNGAVVRLGLPRRSRGAEPRCARAPRVLCVLRRAGAHRGNLVVRDVRRSTVAHRVVVRERGGMGRRVEVGARVAPVGVVRADPPGPRRVREETAGAAGLAGAVAGARAAVRVDGGVVRVRVQAGSAA